MAIAGGVTQTKDYLDSRVMPAIFEALRALDAARDGLHELCLTLQLSSASADERESHSRARGRLLTRGC